MQLGTIFLFKTEYSINHLLGVLSKKNKFQDGCFYEEAWVLIAQRKDPTQKTEILYENIQENILFTSTIKEYSQQNQDLCAKIYRINEELKYDLSWLEILQVAAICNIEQKNGQSFIVEKIKDLFSFYQHIIANETF